MITKMNDYLNSLSLLRVLLEKNHIKHFTMEEITQGWDIPSDLIFNIEDTIIFIDDMREYLDIPIAITSSYRPDWYNKKIGGVPGSMHTFFNAIDSVPVDGKKESLRRMQKYALENRIKGTGVGLYNTFLHFDTRYKLNKRTANWGKLV